MITLGIDLSSQPDKTAACSIRWNEDGSVAVEQPECPCTDDKLDALIRGVDVTGIDAPFGWPEPFRKAVGTWSSGEWIEGLRDELRFRTTDREVSRILKGRLPDTRHLPRPLSVSTDRIALPAMRAMALLLRHGISDKSGADNGSGQLFFEVYPAASLAIWRLPHRQYKSGGTISKAEAFTRRKGIVANLRKWIPEISNDYSADDHALDALVASLSARAAALGLTIHPVEHQELAMIEGWIHIPDPSRCPDPGILLSSPR